jgi:hypothetical protein
LKRVFYRAGLVMLAASLTLAVACGGDDDNDTGTTSAPAATATQAPSGPIQVVARDYEFRNLPQTLPVGAEIQFKNESSQELHEFVAIRLPDNERRPVSELIYLSDEELGEIVETEPTMVLIAPPNKDGFAVLGDGFFRQPGRYAVVCFIPVGADPDEMMQAMEGEAEGPPEADGLPHAFHGMFADITVR